MRSSATSMCGADQRDSSHHVAPASLHRWMMAREDEGLGLLGMLKADPQVMEHISAEDLDAIANPEDYLIYVDTAFERLKLL